MTNDDRNRDNKVQQVAQKIAGLYINGLRTSERQLFTIDVSTMKQQIANMDQDMKQSYQRHHSGACRLEKNDIIIPDINQHRSETGNQHGRYHEYKAGETENEPQDNGSVGAEAEQEPCYL